MSPEGLRRGLQCGPVTGVLYDGFGCEEVCPGVVHIVAGVDGPDPVRGGVTLGENDVVAHLIVPFALYDPVDALLVDDDKIGDVSAGPAPDR